jgi:phage tail sheath protein FI
MPEYLAPGVYVEEIDMGSKPIEGVSTSTTGMVGVTERGPVNVPILVTSYGEYTRWFGERLDILDYSNASGPHCYLPHAAEGFFTNGGKRLYVTRVLDPFGATRAAFALADRGAADSSATILLRAAGEGTGTGGTTPLYVLNIDPPGPGSLANNDLVRVGNGSDAEYRQVDAAGIGAVADTTHVPLASPLARAHAGTTAIHHIPRTDLDFTASVAPIIQLAVNAAAGDTEIVLKEVALGDAGEVVAGNLLEIDTQSPGHAEHRFVTDANADPNDATRVIVTLDSPLALSHTAAPDAVRRLDPAAAPVRSDTLGADAQAGDRLVYVVTRGGDFDVTTDLVFIDDGAASEARRIGALFMLTLSTGAYETYGGGTIVERVNLANSALGPKQLTSNAAAGATVLALDNRVGLNVGDVLSIGTAPNEEFVTVASLPNPSPGGAPPNAGNVILEQPTGRAHASGETVNQQTGAGTINTGAPATSVLLDVPKGGTAVAVTDGTGYGINNFVRVTTSSGGVTYHRLAEAPEDLDARLVSLNVPLTRAHPAGAELIERTPLINVQALDAGAWGNRLRVSVEDEAPGLVSRTSIATIINANSIRLASAAGIEAGTVLEVFNPSTGAAEGDPLKVTSIDRASNYTITLAGTGITPAQSAPGLLVRSREFRLTIMLLRQPDPALPSRNETVIAAETFRHLSLDPRHSRYIEKIVGDINGVLRLSDRRPEGESWYVRVEDLETVQANQEAVRLGPETLVDTLPNGRQRAARHALAGGGDSMATLTDATYLGVDDVEPLNRTGLYTMTTLEDVSLVACPGQTSPTIQGALIDHCELMRYRFAVLDAQRPPDDTLTDVQTQRQQFDTKYAALYHPWLLVPDPYPTNLQRPPDYSIPPSGHVLGIYARTDVERGVHKAPANEVVRGILGLQRILNKGEQDILNPYPININVIRDFRSNNRGIRVFGGRVITSDSDWKYVNVRRLLIFLEHSIDRGMQWVVFEPNAEPLWARVVRTVSDFLTVVWRNGALEGTKVEEAFFVRCDRTTMTQTDIDSGRLICVIGVAPVKPAEFVIIRIGLWTAHAEV